MVEVEQAAETLGSADTLVRVRRTRRGHPGRLERETVDN